MDTTRFSEINLNEHKWTCKRYVKGVVLFAALTLMTLLVLGYVFSDSFG
jgi:hypothetical protein